MQARPDEYQSGCAHHQREQRQADDTGAYFQSSDAESVGMLDESFIEHAKYRRQQSRQYADSKPAAHFRRNAADNKRYTRNDGHTEKQFTRVERPAQEQRLDKRDE